MVGLYHKRRAQRSQSKVKIYMTRGLMSLAGLFVVTLGGIALFVNGSFVKGPLASYLSEKSHLPVEIADAEFSPLYPGVIRLNNVTFGSSQVEEIYLEYDLLKLLRDQTLVLNDIYVNKLLLQDSDLPKLNETHVGFKAVVAHSLRLHHTPLHTPVIATDDATLRLSEVHWTPEQGLSFSDGSLLMEEGKLLDQGVKNITFSFSQIEHGLNIPDFSLAMWGGTVTGSAIYRDNNERTTPTLNTPGAKIPRTPLLTALSISRSRAERAADAPNGDSSAVLVPQLNGELQLSELNLNKVMLPAQWPHLSHLKVLAPQISLNDVIIANEAEIAKRNLENNGAKSQQGVEQSARTVTSTTALTTVLGGSSARENADPKSVPPTFALYQDYVMQGITGKLENMVLTQAGLTGEFVGVIDAFSFPLLQTSFEHNEGKATLDQQRISWSFKGNLYEGSYEATGSLDHAKKELKLDKLSLAQNKVALTALRRDFMRQALNEQGYALTLNQASFKDLELLSYLNTLPISVQQLSGEIKGLSLCKPTNPHIIFTAAQPSPDATSILATTKAISASAALTIARATGVNLSKNLEQGSRLDRSLQSAQSEARTLGANAAAPGAISSALVANASAPVAAASAPLAIASAQFKAHNLLYSNLLLTDSTIKATLTPDTLSFELPDVLFQEARLHAKGKLSLVEGGTSTLQAWANDFETADLNSNLINHMLTGKVNFALDVATPTPKQQLTLSALMQKLTGSLDVSSSGLLVSDFGLDLINGGKKQNYQLRGMELLAALQGSALGLNRLHVHTDFSYNPQVDFSRADLQANLSMTTANASLSAVVDLAATEHNLTGLMNFETTSKDSLTQMDIKGTWEDPVFAIYALTRGVARPGLYLPQYEASAKAKEQTDSAYILRLRETNPDAPEAVRPPETPRRSDDKLGDAQAVVEVGPIPSSSNTISVAAPPAQTSSTISAIPREATTEQAATAPAPTASSDTTTEQAATAPDQTATVPEQTVASTITAAAEQPIKAPAEASASRENSSDAAVVKKNIAGSVPGGAGETTVTSPQAAPTAQQERATLGAPVTSVAATTTDSTNTESSTSTENSINTDSSLNTEGAATRESSAPSDNDASAHDASQAANTMGTIAPAPTASGTASTASGTASIASGLASTESNTAPRASEIVTSISESAATETTATSTVSNEVGQIKQTVEPSASGAEIQETGAKSVDISASSDNGAPEAASQSVPTDVDKTVTVDMALEATLVKGNEEESDAVTRDGGEALVSRGTDSSPANAVAAAPAHSVTANAAAPDTANAAAPAPANAAAFNTVATTDAIKQDAISSVEEQEAMPSKGEHEAIPSAGAQDAALPDATASSKSADTGAQEISEQQSAAADASAPPVAASASAVINTEANSIDNKEAESGASLRSAEVLERQLRETANEAEATRLEQKLLKEAIIQSIISPVPEDDEEELIF